MNVAKGYRPTGDINACEYVNLNGTEDGFEVRAPGSLKGSGHICMPCLACSISESTRVLT